MKKRYLLCLILLTCLSIAGIPLLVNWLQEPEQRELAQLRVEGWVVVELEGVSETKEDFSVRYIKATADNPPVDTGGWLFHNQPPSNPNDPLQMAESNPPTAIGIKIIDNKLTVTSPLTQTMQLGNRTYFQQAIDMVWRGRSPDPVITVSRQTVTLDSTRPSGHTAKLLPIPDNRLPFNQPVRVVEWIPDDPSLPIEYGLLKLEPLPPTPSPPQPPKP